MKPIQYFNRLKQVIKFLNWNSEKCQTCGRPYGYVWRAPDDLWKKVTGEQHGGGLRCISCFDEEAQRKGCKILYWECTEGEWAQAYRLQAKKELSEICHLIGCGGMDESCPGNINCELIRKLLRKIREWLEQ